MTRTYQDNSIERQIVANVSARRSSLPARPGLVKIDPKRRGSHDEHGGEPWIFQLYVKDTIDRILRQEDSDKNYQVTTLDNGPKVVMLGTANSDSTRNREVRGTYYIASLLENLSLTEEHPAMKLVDFGELAENPVVRTERKIREYFWRNLTRRLDDSLIDKAAPDPKDWTAHPRPRIYVPFTEVSQYEYYVRVSHEKPHLNLDVQYLPPGGITPELADSLSDRPGLLALGMHRTDEPGSPLRGNEFIVPGDRFNEFYYWDSYFAALGILEVGRPQLAAQIVGNFVFEIQHYGKILNANRTYYLSRSQPPFLTDLAIRTFNAFAKEDWAIEFLRTAISAAIKEYRQVWTSEPRLDPKTGLSRYRPPGGGIPLEVEPGHFDYILGGYAKKHDISMPEFTARYNAGQISEPALDEFLLHDRAVRESGHDTSRRFDLAGAGNLATVDLNCLLYKYETDIAWAIEHVFGGQLVLNSPWCSAGVLDDHVETADGWRAAAAARRDRMWLYQWNEQEGIFFDYDTVRQVQSCYEYVTTFYPLWAGLASPRQAELLITKALPHFERPGGLVTSTERARGPVTPMHPQKQWDYPFGWAPHQILTWQGLNRYGFKEQMQRLVYRWLYILTRGVVDFNGSILEKYDVTQPDNPNGVSAEYGNQGSNFRMANREGFGWTNASYSLGLALLKDKPVMIKALGLCAPYEKLSKRCR